MTREGLKLNPYDPNVMHKIDWGDQMTVLFHVDDLEVLHKSDKAITKVIEYPNGIYPGLNEYVEMYINTWLLDLTTQPR